MRSYDAHTWHGHDGDTLRILEGHRFYTWKTSIGYYMIQKLCLFWSPCTIGYKIGCITNSCTSACELYTSMWFSSSCPSSLSLIYLDHILDILFQIGIWLIYLQIFLGARQFLFRRTDYELLIICWRMQLCDCSLCIQPCTLFSLQFHFPHFPEQGKKSKTLSYEQHIFTHCEQTCLIWFLLSSQVLGPCSFWDIYQAEEDLSEQFKSYIFVSLFNFHQCHVLSYGCLWYWVQSAIWKQAKHRCPVI